MASETTAPGDHEFGIHSNIPECCVRFYCTRPTNQIVRLNDERDTVEPRYVGYVMCVECWEKFHAGKLTPNVVHICVDSRDDPLCHAYLSGPDRSVGAPIKARYVQHWRDIENVA